MSYTSTVSAPLRQFHPVFWLKTFTDGPTSARWSKLLSWGATGVLRVPAVFRECILRVVFRGSVLRILSIYQVFRGSILRIIRYSQYSNCSDSQYSQYSGLRYCSYFQYSQYEMYSILGVYSKYEVYGEHLCNVANSRSRAFRLSTCMQEKVPTRA